MSSVPILVGHSASLSDVGTVRSVNEDSYLELPVSEGGLWVVADGMGGHEAGDVASRMVVDSLRGVVASNNLGALIDDAEERILGVNHELCVLASQTYPPRTIGTTVVAFMSYHSQAACMWAGDSRVYQLREGVMEQLTRDHTEVEELMRQNNFTEDEALNYTTSNVITRAVGGEPNLQLEVKFQALCPGDRYMLCSDGLYNAVPKSEMLSLLAAGDPAVVSEALVRRSLEHGARDNVTVIVVDFHDGM